MPSKLKVTIGGEEILQSDSDSSVEEEDEIKGIENTFVPIGAKRSRTRHTIHLRIFYHHEYQGICIDSSNYYDILENDSDNESDDDDNEEKNDGINKAACVGAGIGGGYKHSKELKLLNYKQAMKSNEEKE